MSPKYSVLPEAEGDQDITDASEEGCSRQLDPIHKHAIHTSKAILYLRILVEISILVLIILSLVLQSPNAPTWSSSKSLIPNCMILALEEI